MVGHWYLTGSVVTGRIGQSDCSCLKDENLRKLVIVYCLKDASNWQKHLNLKKIDSLLSYQNSKSQFLTGAFEFSFLISETIRNSGVVWEIQVVKK